MASIPPFPNVYQLKKVGQSDAKSCNICYKPTQSCLLSLKYLNSATERVIDFFYVCDSHLSDSNFCTIRYIDESSGSGAGAASVGLSKQKLIGDLTVQQTELLNKIQHLELLIQKQNSQLTKITNYLWKKKSDDKGKDDEDDKDSQEKQKQKQSLKDEELNLIQLESRLKETKGKLSNLEVELSQNKKKYAKFELDHLFYKNRLNNYLKKIAEKKRQELISKPGFFPDVSSLPKVGTTTPETASEDVKKDDDTPS